MHQNICISIFTKLKFVERHTKAENSRSVKIGYIFSHIYTLSLNLFKVHKVFVPKIAVCEDSYIFLSKKRLPEADKYGLSSFCVVFIATCSAPTPAPHLKGRGRGGGSY